MRDKFSKFTLILLLCTALHSTARADDVLSNYPVIPSISGTLASHLTEVVERGKTLGNRLDVFSKVGDSITVDVQFLTPIGKGNLRLAGYESLRATVKFFSKTSARTSNSFANISLAAHGLWSTRTVLDPGASFSRACRSGETPLDCELRVTKPSVALIMFGANDVNDLGEEEFETNLNRIVDITEAHGVIPVLSTTLPRLVPKSAEGRVVPYNLITVRVAQQRLIPLWNYWLAVSSLPNAGLSPEKVHPSVPDDQNTAFFDKEHLVYGMNMRNLTALQVLDALRPILR